MKEELAKDETYLADTKIKIEDDENKLKKRKIQYEEDEKLNEKKKKKVTLLAQLLQLERAWSDTLGDWYLTDTLFGEMSQLNKRLLKWTK